MIETHETKKKTLVKIGVILVVLAFACLVFASAASAAEPTVVKTEKELRDAVTAGGDVKLGCTITIGGALQVKKESGPVTIDLNGYDIKSKGKDRVIDIHEGANLTVKDTSTTAEDKMGKITGGKIKKDGGGVLVMSNATFTLESGVICKNTATGSPSAKRNGGGVCVWDGGKFYMKGGAISNNETEWKDGGGVYLGKNCTFVMSGGTIHNNTGDNSGGGVCMVGENSRFIMSGGEIFKNKADDHDGGGVCLQKGATFEMTGGKIYDNFVDNKGGGVFVSDGAFTMTGGEIYKNEVDDDAGGGVALINSTFTMSNGKIYDNYGHSYGGGVFFDTIGMKECTFTMTGGEIYGNDSGSSNGGGVYISGVAVTFDMSGGTIHNNKSGRPGGGVYIGSGTHFKVSGSASIRNNDDRDDLAFYVDEMSDSFIIKKEGLLGEIRLRTPYLSKDHPFATIEEGATGAGNIFSEDGKYVGEVKDNKVYWVKSEGKEHKVTFDMMGHGTPVPKEQTIKHGEHVTKPETPSEEHYLFVDWYKDSACTVKWDFDNNIVTEDITLYAKWSEYPKYPVEFDMGGIGEAPETQIVYDGDHATKPADPEVYGYKFLGWFGKDGKEYTFEEKVEGNVTVYAHWSMLCSVVFDARGHGEQEVIMPQTVEYGQTLSEVPELYEPAYTFEGWYYDKEFTGKYDLKDPIVQRLTMLYAKWKKHDEFTVKFDVQGHGTAPPLQHVLSGEIVTRPDDPTAEGYKFIGWYTEAECKTAWKFEDPVEKDMTLYAKWEDEKPGETITITFDLDGGSSKKPIPKQVIHVGDKIIQPENPTKKDYKFDGWYTEKGCKGKQWNFNDPATKTMTLYAGWKEEGKGLYSISVKTIPAEGGVTYPWCYTAAEGNEILVYAVPKDGYTFDKFETNPKVDVSISTEGKKTIGQFKMPRSDITVTALYKTSEYKVTCNQTAGGHLSANVKKAVPGTTITFTAKPNTGYHIEGNVVQVMNLKTGEVTPVEVTKSAEGYIGSYTMPDSDVTAQATFSKDEEQHAIITKIISGKGIIKAVPSIASEGKDVIIYLVPETGSNIEKLTVDGVDVTEKIVTEEGYYYYSFKMGNKDITAEVTFAEEKKYNVTIGKHDHGSMSTSVTQAAEGDKVTVKVVPDKGYAVSTVNYVCGGKTTMIEGEVVSDYWKGKFEMPAGDVTVNAVLVVSPTTVTVTFDPVGGTVTPTTKGVTVGQKYGDLPIPKKPSSKFLGWYSDNTYSEKSLVTKDTVVAIKENHTLYAKWEEGMQISIKAGTGGKVSQDKITGIPVKGGARYKINSENRTLCVVAYGGYISEKITATPSSGYEFDGWYIGTKKLNDRDVVVDKSVIVAKFTGGKNITIKAGDGGSVNKTEIKGIPDGATYSVKGNNLSIVSGGKTIAIIIATPDSGYTFKNWTLKGGKVIETGTNVENDQEVTANFSQKTLSVTIESNDTEKGSVSKDKVTGILAGSKYTVTNEHLKIGEKSEVVAVPNSGYSFKNWTIDGKEIQTNDSVNDNDKIIANFEAVTPKETVTVYLISEDVMKGTVDYHIIRDVEKSTKIEGSATTPELTINGQKVTATPNEGYKFEKWDGYPEGGIITKDILLTATWANAPGYVTVTWENWDKTILETDSVKEGDVPVYHGATPEKESEAHVDYWFTGWYPDPEEYRAEEGRIYTAQFRDITKIDIKETSGGEVTFDTKNTESLYSVNLGLELPYEISLGIIYVARDELPPDEPEGLVGDIFRIALEYDGELIEYDFDADVTFLITADDMAKHPEWKANPEKFVLYHYKDGEWKSLTTTYVNDVEGNYFFKATTDGFSPFAIGYVENQPTPTPSHSGGSSVSSFTAVKNGDTFTFNNSNKVTEATLPGATSARITSASGDGWYNFNLTADGFTGNGSMKFQVPLDVLSVRGVTTSDVGLYHQENGEWALKPTTLLTTDNQYAYYKGTFDSCSPFKIDFIVGSSSGTATETKKEDTQKTEEKTSKTDTSGTTEKKEETQKSTETQKSSETTKKTEEKAKSPFPVLGILAGLGAATLLLRRK